MLLLIKSESGRWKWFFSCTHNKNQNIIFRRTDNRYVWHEIGYRRKCYWFLSFDHLIYRRTSATKQVIGKNTHNTHRHICIDHWPIEPEEGVMSAASQYIYKQHLIARKILAARPQRTPKDAWWLETGKRTKFKQRIYGQRRTPNCDSCTPHYASTPSVCWSDCEMLAQIFTHSSRYTKKC